MPEHGEEDGGAGAEDGLVRREAPLVGGGGGRRRRVARGGGGAVLGPAYQRDITQRLKVKETSFNTGSPICLCAMVASPLI